MNRKLDEVKTVKYDLEHSGAVKDQKLLQKKLNDYYALDDSFCRWFLCDGHSRNCHES